jgi:hypothetical protein
MANAKFKLDGNTPTVTWADPKSAPDHSAAAQVNRIMLINPNSLKAFLKCFNFKQALKCSTKHFFLLLFSLGGGERLCRSIRSSIQVIYCVLQIKNL